MAVDIGESRRQVDVVVRKFDGRPHRRTRSHLLGEDKLTCRAEPFADCWRGWMEQL